MALLLIKSGVAATAPEPSIDSLMQDEFGNSKLWMLDVSRNDVEPLIAEFQNAYNAGNAARTARLFAPKVITGDGPRTSAELGETYEEHYLGTVSRYLNLRNARWRQIEKRVSVEVDFSLREQSRLDGKDRDYTGAIRFYLEPNGAKWQITEIYFAYDPPPEFRPPPKAK